MSRKEIEIANDGKHKASLASFDDEKEIPLCAICRETAIGEVDGHAYCSKCFKERYPAIHQVWNSEPMRQLMRQMKTS